MKYNITDVYDIELCSQSGTHIQGPHYFDM